MTGRPTHCDECGTELHEHRDIASGKTGMTVLHAQRGQGVILRAGMTISIVQFGRRRLARWNMDLPKESRSFFD